MGAGDGKFMVAAMANSCRYDKSCNALIRCWWAAIELSGGYNWWLICVTCGTYINRRLLRPSDVRMTAPVSYFSSGPLEASDSIRVYDQWRLEVLAPAWRVLQPAAPEACGLWPAYGPRPDARSMWLGHVVPGSFRRGPRPAAQVGPAAGGAVQRCAEQLLSDSSPWPAVPHLGLRSRRRQAERTRVGPWLSRTSQARPYGCCGAVPILQQLRPGPNHGRGSSAVPPMCPAGSTLLNVRGPARMLQRMRYKTSCSRWGWLPKYIPTVGRWPTVGSVCHVPTSVCVYHKNAREMMGLLCQALSTNGRIKLGHYAMPWAWSLLAFEEHQRGDTDLTRNRQNNSNRGRKSKTMNGIDTSLKLSKYLEKYPKLWTVSWQSGEALDDEVAKLGELTEHEQSWWACETWRAGKDTSKIRKEYQEKKSTHSQ